MATTSTPSCFLRLTYSSDTSVLIAKPSTLQKAKEEAKTAFFLPENSVLQLCVPIEGALTALMDSSWALLEQLESENVPLTLEVRALVISPDLKERMSLKKEEDASHFLDDIGRDLVRRRRSSTGSTMSFEAQRQVTPYKGKPKTVETLTIHILFPCSLLDFKLECDTDKFTLDDLYDEIKRRRPAHDAIKCCQRNDCLSLEQEIQLFWVRDSIACQNITIWRLAHGTS